MSKTILNTPPPGMPHVGSVRSAGRGWSLVTGGHWPVAHDRPQSSSESGQGTLNTGAGMAFSCHYKWRHSFLKRMDRVIKLNLNLPANYKLLSTILLGYEKMDEEELVTRDKVRTGIKRKRFGSMKIFWKRKKYEQL